MEYQKNNGWREWMRNNSRCLSCAGLLGRLVFLLLLSCQLWAKDCELLKSTANNQLQEIHNDLLQIVSREQYEAAIQKRYDKVEDMLQTANHCLKQKNNKDWKGIKKILTGLRSNARTLLFTKFENWMQIKEQDSTLFKKPETIKPVSAAAKNDTGSPQ
jgi:hypothetical protein